MTIGNWGRALLFIFLLLLVKPFAAVAVELSSLSWTQVCFGKMGEEWYGSDEARMIADRVVHIQKTTGGWMKNYEIHLLSDDEIEALYEDRFSHSCLDNNATTQEMQFLARVFAKTQVEGYRQSFVRGLQMILTAQKANGGWSQFWPLYGGGRYHDYITFNDNLITNVLRLLHNIVSNRGDYAEIVDASTREDCERAFDRCIELIIKCQVDDNGTPSAWCAQHHNTTFIPVEGRPFELPSISGYESATLLSFLMTIERPSPALQNTIRTAVAWLDAHKIVDKAVESFTNADGEPDKRIIDKPGSSVCARFIQLGGPTGEAIYQAFFEMLRSRGKSRSYTWEGQTYTYTEYEIASSSYDPERAYQPIFSIYNDDYPHLYYRFLYNYEDADPVPDANGVPVATSLSRGPRCGYGFMDSWGERLINTEYPAWELRMMALADSEGYNLYQLSQGSYLDSDIDGSNVTYLFSDGISVSNNQGKQYAKGLGYTDAIKYSANVEYTIHLPEDFTVTQIRFTGYDNYSDADAYIRRCNGVEYSPSDYLFPAKDESGNPSVVMHTLDCSDHPATGEIRFSIGGKQCGLVITLCTPDPQSGLTEIECTPTSNASGFYDLQGRRTDPNFHPGIYMKNNGKFIVR